MRVGKLIMVLLSLSFTFGSLAQQTTELSYDEMIEIEEIHLSEIAVDGSGGDSSEVESSPPPTEPPEDLEPPE